jgi:hypothetical protein
MTTTMTANGRQWTPRDDADAVAVAGAMKNRAQAEIRLLIAIAPLGRWGLALAGRAGITARHFHEDDTLAIFGALLVAHDPRRVAGPDARRMRALLLARRAMDDADLWDAADCRPFIVGSRWGPGPLSALFTVLSRAEAEAALPDLAGDLVAIDSERRAVA